MSRRTVWMLLIVVCVLGVIGGVVALWAWALFDASYEVTLALGIQSFAFFILGGFGAALVGEDL